jgi:hypothetical protein
MLRYHTMRSKMVAEEFYLIRMRYELFSVLITGDSKFWIQPKEVIFLVPLLSSLLRSFTSVKEHKSALERLRKSFINFHLFNLIYYYKKRILPSARSSCSVRVEKH